MARANDVEKAKRLNHARDLLKRFDDLPAAVERMVRDCAVSPRQAYRYLEQARQLTRAVPVREAKIAFTVKLSRGLVARLRSHARTTGLSLSELVGQALEAMLRRRGSRG
jgi:predicted DNA-binding transcriptional regulator YafY